MVTVNSKQKRPFNYILKRLIILFDEVWRKLLIQIFAIKWNGYRAIVCIVLTPMDSSTYGRLDRGPFGLPLKDSRTHSSRSQ